MYSRKRPGLSRKGVVYIRNGIDYVRSGIVYTRNRILHSEYISCFSFSQNMSSLKIMRNQYVHTQRVYVQCAITAGVPAS